MLNCEVLQYLSLGFQEQRIFGVIIFLTCDKFIYSMFTEDIRVCGEKNNKSYSEQVNRTY